MSKEVATVLKNAHDLIDKVGWVQREYGNPQRGYCMYGAIDATGAQYPELTRCRDAVDAVVGGNGIQYNDHPKRTKAQVLAALKKAIKAELSSHA